MIIYGWGNFNRRDHSLVRGTCRSCGRAGYLKSYTSSKFFTLYFIPVIPLGSQKIVQDCPHCKQAFGMGVRKWRKLQREDLPAAVRAYEASPANAETAKALLGTCVHLQDRDTALRYGPQIRAGFARDADMLGFLAGTYSYLCLDREADAVYLEATALSSDEALTREANSHLELQKLAKPAAPHRLLQSLPVLIVPAILLFVFLHFAQETLSSGLKHAYLINGLDRAYTVVINGERVKLGAHRVVTTDALEIGTNHIGPVDGASYPEAATFEVDVSWFKRAFSSPTAVVNPDGAAVLVWEKSGYAYPKAPDDVGDYRVHSGRIVHVFEDLDYRFEDFPSSISVPSGGGVVYKTRVADASSYELTRLLGMLGDPAKGGDLAGYLRARLGSGDESTSMIHLASRFLPAGEFRQLAATRIELRPVRIEWHRAYQTLLEGTAEAPAMVAKYRAFAEAEPGDSALQYLYARALDDPAEAVPVFEKAVHLSPPSGYAANALAYHYLLEGDFATAAKWSAEARGIEPDNAYFRRMRVAAAYGIGDYATIDSELGDNAGVGESRIAAFYAHLYRLGKMGQTARVETEIKRFIALTKSAGEIDDADVAAASAYLESAVAVATGDRARFTRCATRMKGSALALPRALVEGDLDRALKLESEQQGRISMEERLVLYLLLSRAGRNDAASTQLARAVEALREGGADEKRWAGWLSGNEAPAVAAAAHACPDIDIHHLYLAVLAQRFPDHAAEYLQHAMRVRWVDSFATLALATASAN